MLWKVAGREGTIFSLNVILSPGSSFVVHQTPGLFNYLKTPVIFSVGFMWVFRSLCPKAPELIQNFNPIVIWGCLKGHLKMLHILKFKTCYARALKNPSQQFSMAPTPNSFSCVDIEGHQHERFQIVVIYKRTSQRVF